MMYYTRTGVHATAEEINEIKSAQTEWGFDPLAARRGPKVPKGMSPQETIHAVALAHGLPESNGFYGIDLSNGEFLCWPEKEGG